MTKALRGKSKAMQDAQAFFAKNPQTTAQELAKQFGLHLITIYRSDWWKRRDAGQQEKST